MFILATFLFGFIRILFSVILMILLQMLNCLFMLYAEKKSVMSIFKMSYLFLAYLRHDVIITRLDRWSTCVMTSSLHASIGGARPCVTICDVLR